MKRPEFVVLALSAVIALGVATPTQAAAQDYALYETQYISVFPGHSSAMNEAMASHNERFHADGPYGADVYFVVNGRRAGQLSWVMGPATFTQLDDRPSGEPHDPDWGDNVLAHGEPGLTEYWVLNDELSYTPAMPAEGAGALLLVRYFDVTDVALFVKVQGQIKAAQETLGSPRARNMFRRQFMAPGSRDWAIVVPYANWAELDQEGGNFREAFIETHGEAAWATFGEEFDAAVASRYDEWLQLIP